MATSDISPEAKGFISSSDCKRLLQTHLRGLSQQKNVLLEQQLLHMLNAQNQNSPHDGVYDGKAPPRFPPESSEFAVGLSRVNRDEFAQAFDMGVPLDESSTHNAQVLIVHQTQAALPSNPLYAKEVATMTPPPLLSVQEATEQCDIMAVALLEHSPQGTRKQCLALMGQYESWHLQKWMRLPPRNNTIANRQQRGLNSQWPLRYVNRGAQPSGRVGNVAPDMATTRTYWEVLQRYLESWDDNLQALEPIVQRIARQNTVVVMVCNFGQSELLLNFICHARRHNHDLSNVLVFATDEETRDLVAGMGLAVYYDQYNYQTMPKEAAKRYADRNFRSMMMAKVFCVHMALALGYDVLFQDVDVVWWKNPLEYFHSNVIHGRQEEPFDIYFQDDGNHALYYAPYSANTGFYYVRHNDITMHFFNSFLMAGDTIIATRSHQVALIALLGEHASLYGLRVKVFNRNSDEFPGGHAFNKRRSYMKDLFAKAVQPYIFHMSWTVNKVNKQKYFEQMGEWYLQPACVQKSVQDLPSAASHDMAGHCCLSEPIVQCHYRDKPSIIPCRDSPPIDAGMRSWW